MYTGIMFLFVVIQLCYGLYRYVPWDRVTVYDLFTFWLGMLIAKVVIVIVLKFRSDSHEHVSE